MEVELRQGAVELPATIHGFAIEFLVGPYPPDAPHSHRRAVYAKLRPTTQALTRRLRGIGRDLILGIAELDRDAAARIHDDDELAERAALAALRPAAKLARTVKEA